MQKLADETGLRIAVCHFPPGTSKWNKIEHRLFSYITQNWRGKPLRSFQTIVNLIAATTTKTGLKVHAELNTETYQSGIKVSDEELAQVKIRRDKFHGDWNYEIQPRSHILNSLFLDSSLGYLLLSAPIDPSGDPQGAAALAGEAGSHQANGFTTRTRPYRCPWLRSSE